MGSSGNYFSEYGNSKRYDDWRKHCSDGSDGVFQLRFRQVVRCGPYGFALITDILILELGCASYFHLFKRESQFLSIRYDKSLNSIVVPKNLKAKIKENKNDICCPTCEKGLLLLHSLVRN